jgi:hypothetical protein
MENKNIQFFFNRPERPVNSGRISTIRSETYSNSSEIDPASDVELDEFIAKFRISERGGSASGDKETVTTVAEKVRSFFRRDQEGNWILKGGEHEECECKQDFDPKKISSVVRAVAAFANNKGGYLLFGVSNSGYSVSGISDVFSKTDIVQIVEKVKAHLSPTPTIAIKDTIELEGVTVGFLCVAKHPNPPVVVYRDGENLYEGDILFRYPGQSARIKFGGLRSMLDERDRRAQVTLANAARRIADVGTGNALILDTNKNILETKGHSILIDQKLAESLRFIKEGEFDEKIGAPTLKLVGEVSPVTVKGAPAIVAHTAIFQEDILEKFLQQAKVDQPIQYIYAGLAQSRLWLPVFYYVRMSERSNADVAELVGDLKISQKGKKKLLVERLEGRREALTKAVSQSASKYSREMTKGIVNTPETIDDVVPFAQGLTAIKETCATLEKLLVAIRKCRQIAEAADSGNALGAIYKAACRVDELYFAQR